MNSKLKARSVINWLLLLFAIFGMAGAVGFATRNAAVAKLYGLNVEHPKVVVTNRLGLVRTTVGFEPEGARFKRTASVWRWTWRNFPSILARISTMFPSIPWRLGISSKPLQLDTHVMEWSTGGSSGGYLYTNDTGPADSKWQFVILHGLKLDELSQEDVTRHFLSGSKETDTISIASGQIILAQPSTHPETIYVLAIRASQGLRAVVDYVAITNKPPSAALNSSR